MAHNDSYLLLENGSSRLLLENGSGDLLLEIDVLVADGGDDWADGYIAAELLRATTRDAKPTRRRIKVAGDEDETDVLVTNGRVTFTAARQILDEEELQAILLLMASV